MQLHAFQCNQKEPHQDPATLTLEMQVRIPVEEKRF